MTDDEQARKERAQRLHEEVEQLKAGRPPRRPASPREFVEEQAREQGQAEPEEEGKPTE